MSFLKKLPNSRREPYGLEIRILKKLPLVTFYSLAIILIFIGVAHLMPPEGTVQEINKHLEMVNILGIAVLITALTAIVTVAIGCFVVYIMKGPAYVIDEYEVNDSEEPKP